MENNSVVGSGPLMQAGEGLSHGAGNNLRGTPRHRLGHLGGFWGVSADPARRCKAGTQPEDTQGDTRQYSAGRRGWSWGPRTRAGAGTAPALPLAPREAAFQCQGAKFLAPTSPLPVPTAPRAQTPPHCPRSSWTLFIPHCLVNWPPGLYLLWTAELGLKSTH